MDKEKKINQKTTKTPQLYVTKAQVNLVKKLTVSCCVGVFFRFQRTANFYFLPSALHILNIPNNSWLDFATSILSDQCLQRWYWKYFESSFNQKITSLNIWAWFFTAVQSDLLIKLLMVGVSTFLTFTPLVLWGCLLPQKLAVPSHHFLHLNPNFVI